MTVVGVRFAAIDLGSNTVKLTVAEVAKNGELVSIEERGVVTRIGEKLDQTGVLQQAAIERTFAALSEFRSVANSLGAIDIGCVGTAGLRGAGNAAQFCQRVKDALGFEVEIIHGLREAELAYRASASSITDGPVIVVDVGGRSTEVIAGVGDRILESVSLEMGSVRLTERHISNDPPTEAELSRVFHDVHEAFASAPAAPGAVDPMTGVETRPTLVGVSGTVMSVMGLTLDLDDMAETVRRGEGRSLLKADIERAFRELKRKTTAERVCGTVVPEGRADVIVAGVAVMLGAVERYGSPTMVASNRGVRYGLLDEMKAKARTR